ncbi:MAG: adenylosuccinate lyase [Fidelibacterota bacterium]
MANSRNVISPLDDRYGKDLEELDGWFSEFALTRYRILIEIEYLIALGRLKGVTQLPPFSTSQRYELRTLYGDFSRRQFLAVKRAENRTQHDVKAVEYFLRHQLQRMGFGRVTEWIHYGLTSEDVNNLAYGLMWKDAVKRVYLPTLTKLVTRLKNLARRYRDVSLLALTHGQPATPTSLGKELAVFASRLTRQRRQLKAHQLQGKLSGATGTWSAHAASYPNVHWINFSKNFVSSLGLEPNVLTTQVESHDSLAESYHILIRINTVLLDFCRDVWHYISRGILRQKPGAGEVGSSTMPHKVNPIRFENAEGNLGIAIRYLSHLAQTLPVSRLQRDLSGSTVIRNQGVPLAHSLLALKNVLKGLEGISVNRERIRQELNNHWEVLGEAIQTVLRKTGDKKAYERLMIITRGQKVPREKIHAFIKELDLPEDEKTRLLALTPESYTGLASKVVEEM